MRVTTETSVTGTYSNPPIRKRGSNGSYEPLNRGFTLIELMVVLFVISFAVAVVLPAFSLSGNTLKAEARKVASVLRYLNETAASKKETLRLSFDLDEGVMSWAEPAERGKELKSLYAVELQSRGVIKEGELTVFFGPMGLGEYLSVYLELDGETMAVSFNPISGRVKIQK